MPALVIMAAGMGSRFGGIKQLAPIGPNGEVIIDYSIHDALQVGFDKIVIILRHEIEREFRARFAPRIEEVCARLGVRLHYVFQRMEDLPEGFALPGGRSKPWGTGQAVLSCREVLSEPFVVINADDYYGKEPFSLLAAFLRESVSETEYAMAGFGIANTLSENGGVKRGICTAENGYLTAVAETFDIRRTAEGIVAGETSIPENALCSMNMWALKPGILPILADEFAAFLHDNGGDVKEEFLLPVVIDRLIRQGRVSVRVLPTAERWFGVTYREDTGPVIASMRELIARGVYRGELYSDLF